MSKTPTSRCVLEAAHYTLPINVRVKNYRGEISERRIKAITLWFGTTQYHPKPQWILTAKDLGRDVIRDFAVKDMVPL